VVQITHPIRQYLNFDVRTLLSNFSKLDVRAAVQLLLWGIHVSLFQATEGTSMERIEGITAHQFCCCESRRKELQ
jgi:hypothetical protein